MGNTNRNSSSASPAFTTTSWSMILEASGEEGAGATEALSDLCQRYWFPLYAFVRGKGFDRSQAEDLTQAFFAELLAKKRIQFAEPSRGSFRTFLLASLMNFISNHWRSEKALKRGGGQNVLSIDYGQADTKYADQPADPMTPEKIFERNWALSILEQTLASVEQQYQDSGKSELFGTLKCFLSGDDEVAYSELSESTGMREGALKVAVHRLRQRYGQQLRLQIAKTVDSPAAVDEELAALFQALS